MLKKFAYWISVCLVLATATGAQAVELAVSSSADTYVINNDTTPQGGTPYMYLHDTANGFGYVRFDLGALNVTSVQDATLTLYTSGGAPRNDNVVTGRFALNGLNNVAGNTAQNWDEATLTSANVGAEWTTNAGASLVNVTVMDGDTNPAVTETVTRVGATYYDVGGIQIVVTGAPLVEFLQSRVEDGGLVTFILEFTGSGGGRGYGVASKEHTMETIRPVLQLVATTGARTAASNPDPADKATEVPRSTALSWQPGAFAVKHNVYLGTSFADVNAASPAVLVSPGQNANSYDPPGHLEFGQTYYWRIDEVNAPPSSAVHPGAVWSFTVEPVAYEITGVTATASSSDTGLSPANLVNGQGLDATRLLHSTLDTAMWLSGKNIEQPAWVQFEFDGVYKLHEMWVWNYNVGVEGILGMGFKDVAVEYSSDGTTWATLGDKEFARGASAADYAHNTTVDFGGVAAKYVKLTAKSNWGGFVKQYGLSEVRFFQIPVHAKLPVPASATTNLDPRTAVLSWKAGREAASHELYLATDVNAVTHGTVTPIIAEKASYAPPSLQLGSTYYWKVVEVNQAETPAAWASSVWNFSTPQFLVVDDFESYTNNSPTRVFQTWMDGLGFSEDEFFPNGGQGNGSGSIVGYDPAAGDIMERTTRHGGRQSMPLYYDNSSGTRYSEAVRTFAQPQDWSKYGITTLVLYFRGDVNNVSAPLYVKINGAKVQFNNGAPSTSLAIWKQWNIDLASFGAALKSVNTLAIGVGNGTAGGTGTILIDDILLYAVPPQVAVPADPGTNGLAALYSFEGTVQDSSGKNLNGTANGEPVYVNGPAGMGKAMTFDGVNDYVDLPIGPLISSMSSTSIGAWVYFNNTGGNWQRIFDFGNPGVGTANPNNYMFLTCNNNNARTVRFAMRMTTSTGEQGVNAPTPALAVGWHHVAIVIDGAAMTLRLYQDGLPVGSGTTNMLPKDLGATTQNWLGRSQWAADAYLSTSLDDVRIFNRALSEGEVRYLAGDR